MPSIICRVALFELLPELLKPSLNCHPMSVLLSGLRRVGSFTIAFDKSTL